MASQYYRPLPLPPDIVGVNSFNRGGQTRGPTYNTSAKLATGNHSAVSYVPASTDIYAQSFSFFPSYPYTHYTSRTPDSRNEDATTSLPVGTLLHKGFYDLLALIPSTASTASRFLWGPPKQDPVIAGPRYEVIERQPAPPPHALSPVQSPTKLSPRKGRRISKDSISKPMNFV